MSDLVGNPEDRFSHNKAHIAVSNRVEENGVYETGPFDVDFRKRRVDSTTYTVKSGLP